MLPEELADPELARFAQSEAQSSLPEQEQEQAAVHQEEQKMVC